MNIITQLPYRESSRKKSFVTIEQVEREHWMVIQKICDVLYSGRYNQKCIDYARSVLDFLVDWEFISWKQFDSIMSLNPIGKFPYVLMTRDKTRVSEGDYYINVASSKIKFTVQCDNSNRSQLAHDIKTAKTDKQMDRVYQKIFGHPPIFEENEEGMVTSYDKSGNRCFLLPTGDEEFPF